MSTPANAHRERTAEQFVPVRTGIVEMKTLVHTRTCVHTQLSHACLSAPSPPTSFQAVARVMVKAEF